MIQESPEQWDSLEAFLFKLHSVSNHGVKYGEILQLRHVGVKCCPIMSVYPCIWVTSTSTFSEVSAKETYFFCSKSSNTGIQAKPCTETQTVNDFFTKSIFLCVPNCEINPLAPKIFSVHYGVKVHLFLWAFVAAITARIQCLICEADIY